MTVNRKRKFTVRELAGQFGVSSRTILRDLQELSELGVPLYSEVGPHGGYQVLNERVLPPIAFTESEAVAMFFASHALRHYSSLPFEGETASALTKFVAHLPNDLKDRIDQMRNRVDIVTPTREQASPFLTILLDAAIARKPLAIEYDSREGMSRREIMPVGIYASNGFWYCPAFCYLRNDYRKFRVDYMRSVVYAGEKSSVAGTPQQHIDLTNWDMQGAVSERVRIYVELSRIGVRRCQTELAPRPQITMHADGSGVMSGTIPRSEIPYFATYFIGLAEEAVVKEPVDLVAMIREKLQAMVRQYENKRQREG